MRSTGSVRSLSHAPESVMITLIIPPRDGIHSVTVPGAVEGWAKMHHRYGKLPWKDLFGAAIAYADQGFPVPEGIQNAWAGESSVKKLEAQEERDP